MEKILSNDIEVAILLEGLDDAKHISNVFRKAGIVPHYYENIQTFWEGTIEDMPALAIVDVKLMNSGEFNVGNHPFVKNEKMALSFFYSDQSLPLLHSTYDIFNFGLVKKSNSYNGQIKSILKRFNKLKGLEIANGELNTANRKHVKQVNGLVEAAGNFQEKEYYAELARALCLEIEQEKNCEDFFTACAKVFSKKEDIAEFAFLELSQSGQKLISPERDDKKFRNIPSLWLGKTCTDGIEFFAQNMASQVALDLMEGEVMALMIRGLENNPQKIIFIKSMNEKFVEKFDWNLFEKYLSGVNSYYHSKLVIDHNLSAIKIGPWELMSILDENVNGSLDGQSKDICLVDVDLSDLVELVRSKSNMHFYWKDFFADFASRFENQYKLDVRVVPMGVSHLGFVANKKKEQQLFSALRSYIFRYSYWRYFEDVDVILARSLSPQIKAIPLSPEAYLQYLGGPQNSVPKMKSSIRPREHVVTV